jgi:acyl carrier protein
MLQKIVNDFLLTQPNITPERLADRSLKMLDLGLDSLGVVEMLFEVEDRYNIRIEDAAQFQSMTVDEVMENIEKLIRDKNGGELPAALNSN